MPPPMNPWQSDIARDQYQREGRGWAYRLPQQRLGQPMPDFWNESPWMPVNPTYDMPGRVLDSEQVMRQNNPVATPPPPVIDDQGGPRPDSPTLPLSEYLQRQHSRQSPFMLHPDTLPGPGPYAPGNPEDEFLRNFRPQVPVPPEPRIPERTPNFRGMPPWDDPVITPFD